MHGQIQQPRRCRICGRFQLVRWGVCLLLVMGMDSVAEDQPAALKTGVLFRQELRRPINVYRQQTSVRELTQRLTELHGIPILLDRRIDPDRIVDVQLARMTLEEGLEAFAAQLGADAAVIGGTVVIGPVEGLDRIRTDISQQRQMLSELQDEQAKQRAFDLILPQTFRWDDLQTPRELSLAVAGRFKLEVTNISLLPHDLWAGGVLSDVNAVEALALIAGQFDLTFSWNVPDSTVELTESPKRLTIEKSYTIGQDKVARIIEAAADEFPQAGFRRDDRGLHVVATVGEHELIAAILESGDSVDHAAAPDQGPLHQRTFTLTIQRVAAMAVLRTLEAQDVIVEYDPDSFDQAGVDLSQKISLSLDEASADVFFQALCEPLGLKFEIDGKTVRLTPKE